MTISCLLRCSLLANDPGHEKLRTNVALGKTYVFNKSTQTTAFTPNYGHSMDEADAIQLTDGKYSDTDGGDKNLFWTQKTTVGWWRQPVVIFTIDLEQVEPISGLSYSTAGQPGNLAWPVAISMFLSYNGAEFYYVGNVVHLSAKRGAPKDEGYSTHRYIADNLATKGRYVRLVIRAGAGGGTFCDEIEVYHGPASLLEQNREAKPLTQVKDMEALSLGLLTDAGARMRMRYDLAVMRKRVEASELASNEKAALLQRLDVLAPQINTFPKINEKGFRATVPLNGLHTQILRINAPLLRHRDLPPLLIWQNNQWDPLEPLQAPNERHAPLSKIKVAMMNNEYRSAAFNLTNTTDRPQVATIRIEELPGGTNPDYVTVHQVEFVDTLERKVIADPLTLAPKTDDGYVIDLPSGLTRQVWLSIHPQDLKPKTYSGRVSIHMNPLGRSGKIQFTLRLSPIRFPKQPTLSLYMWDYAHGGQFGEATDAAIADMRTHYLDSAWGNDDVVPSVKPSDVDDEGNLLTAPDFSSFDDWIKLWQGQGIRHYLIGFHGSRKDFAGKRIGTPAVQRAVSQWATAWADHNQTLGLKPGQVAVNISDEPRKPEDAQRIVLWAKAIKAGTSDILIFIDPAKPVAEWHADARDMLAISDILCPHLSGYSETLPQSGAIYDSLQALGKKFWFYSYNAPATLMDPYDYYRLHAWYSWKYGATGVGFRYYYSYGGSSAWNPYLAMRTSFTPVYISDTDVTSGKHWEAVREGIEDYEYLCMLRDRIAQLQANRKAAAEVAQAQKVLSDALQQVVPGDYSQKKASQWGTEEDRSVADMARLEILEALERLRDY